VSEPIRQVALDAVDLTIGTAAGLYRVAAPPARLALRVARGTPGVRDAARVLRDGGRALRILTQDAVRAEVEILVPVLVDVFLDRIDLTEIVVRRVDLDRVAGELDVDAVVARADLDAAAARLDLDAFLDRVDLTEIVIRRVDLDRVAQGLDLDAFLDRVDLTEIVIRRVDLDRVAQGLDVDAVVARVDLNAPVARLDLIPLAEYVVDGIDLPKIIRESSGTVASEGLRQVRLTSFEADRALAQFMDRVMLRRGARRDGQVTEGGSGAPA
jgi:hypothetical protein